MPDVIERRGDLSDGRLGSGRNILVVKIDSSGSVRRNGRLRHLNSRVIRIQHRIVSGALGDKPVKIRLRLRLIRTSCRDGFGHSTLKRVSFFTHRLRKIVGSQTLAIEESHQQGDSMRVENARDRRRHELLSLSPLLPYADLLFHRQVHQISHPTQRHSIWIALGSNLLLCFLGAHLPSLRIVEDTILNQVKRH